jgi:hypothetical protein
VGQHLVTYPLEIFGCTLPWSLLLLGLLSPDLRRRLGEARPTVLFLITCLAVTFPTCWLVPGARGRYFMPLFPCLAPLIGLVVQRGVESEPSSFLRNVWRIFLTAMGFAMIVWSLAVISASWLGYPKISMLIQDGEFALVYGAVGGALGGFVWWIGRLGGQLRAGFGILAVVCFLSLTQSGLVLNFTVRKNATTAEEVAELKKKLTGTQELVSFGPIPHVFAYYFRDPVTLESWPSDAADPAGQVHYFCFEQLGSAPLPFPWEKMATISCDRDRTLQPESVVIVGRRLNARFSRPACGP